VCMCKGACIVLGKTFARHNHQIKSTTQGAESYAKIGVTRAAALRFCVAGWYHEDGKDERCEPARPRKHHHGLVLMEGSQLGEWASMIHSTVQCHT
jgi:hypothetical protein